jgi:hypothetical protein
MQLRHQFRRRSPLFFRAAALAVLLALALAGGLATAQDPRQADIIVQFDAQARVARTIEFTEPISGLAALALSGLEVVTVSTGFGPAVCSIEGVGCPADDCFCDANRYWGYSYWDGAAWQSYMVGAGSSIISQTGAIEGWRWGAFGDSSQPATAAVQALGGLAWLEARQTITGDFGGMSASVETMLAIGANALPASTWQRTVPPGFSLENYAAANGATFSRAGAGAAGKLATALAASESCLPAGAVTPSYFYSPTLGAYSSQSGANAWAILGALSLSETVPAAAVDTLAAAAAAEGGWEWAPGWGADTNSTALAIQALVAAQVPVTSPVIVAGLAFLATAQGDDGGFAYAPGPGAGSDANSTAYVVQALIAAGEDPAGVRWTANGLSGLDYLTARRQPDGSTEWQAGTGSNQFATQQAIPALLGRPYPVRQASLAACPAVFMPSVMAAQ